MQGRRATARLLRQAVCPMQGCLLCVNLSARHRSVHSWTGPRLLDARRNAGRHLLHARRRLLQAGPVRFCTMRRPLQQSAVCAVQRVVYSMLDALSALGARRVDFKNTPGPQIAFCPILSAPSEECAPNPLLLCCLFFLSNLMFSIVLITFFVTPYSISCHSCPPEPQNQNPKTSEDLKT